MKAPLPHLENWTPDQAARMENAIFVAQHRLQDLEMFRDEHLIDTLDRHPRQDLGINTSPPSNCLRRSVAEKFGSTCGA